MAATISSRVVGLLRNWCATGERAHGQRVVRVAGEDDPADPGVQVADSCEQFSAVHAGHLHVRHDGVDSLLGENRERLFPSGCEGHLPALALFPQRQPQAAEDLRLVVDEEDAELLLRRAHAVTPWRTGSSMRKVVPSPGRLSKVSVPRCFSRMMLWAIARPCPVPLPTSLVVKKGSKMLPADLLGDPGARIRDLERDALSERPRPDRDRAPVLRSADLLLDRVRRVHDQVQEDLVDVAEVALHSRDLPEVLLHVGDVADLVVRDGQRGANGLVEVGGREFGGSGVREPLHGADDVRDALDTINGSVDRAGYFLLEQLQVGLVLGALDLAGAACLHPPLP